MLNGKIAEIFRSFDGEHNSEGIGSPTVFIRFFGCTCGCVYCDTPQKTGYLHYTPKSVRKIVEQMTPEEIKKVTITGGEPLEQLEFFMLVVNELYEYTITVETNGKHPRPHAVDNSFVMDFKMPTSECYNSNDLENILTLSEHDYVKFVIADFNDYETALFHAEELTLKYDFQDDQIIFSPIYSDDHKYANILARKMIESKLPYRFSYQLHKIVGFK